MQEVIVQSEYVCSFVSRDLLSEKSFLKMGKKRREKGI